MPHTTDWAKVHTAYNFHDAIPQDDPALRTKAAEWHKLQASMPHGKLIEDNSFFHSHKENKMYLVHGTSSMDAILESGVLYASAGCLIGSVYCTQVFPEGDRFRMHNLGDYILHKEVPSILAAHHKLKRDSTLLFFEIDLPANSNPLRAGIDYLRMGHIHFGLYQSLQYLLTDQERQTIESRITAMIQSSLGFLTYSNHLFLTDPHLTLEQAKDYLSKMNLAALDLPMLGYLYFEAISEYLMLNSVDPITLDLAQKKEFNNWLYKEIMYGIHEDLKRDFSISRFNPKADELSQYIAHRKVVGRLDVDMDGLLKYVAERVLYWVNTRFFSTPGALIERIKSTSRFDDLSEMFSPLMGHCVHRQLRTQNRYREFYFYFDHFKALEIWNYWNKSNIAIPFNGVFPKGEIGINPAFTNMSYKVYRATALPGDTKYVRPVEELPLEIVPRLIELDKSFMRAGGHYSLHKQKGKQYARA